MSIFPEQSILDLKIWSNMIEKTVNVRNLYTRVVMTESKHGTVYAPFL